MKKMNFLLSIIVITLVAAGTVLIVPNAAAADTGITGKLQTLVTKLNAKQQEALLVLLEAMTAAPEQAGTASNPSAKEALFDALKSFESAGATENFTLEPFLARISEDFKHPVVHDKAGVRSWLDAMSYALFKDGKPLIKFDVSDVEVTEDGKTAEAYPIDIDTPIGSVTVQINARLESDGVWRVVGIEGL